MSKRDIDRINKKTMRGSVSAYSWQYELTKCEKAALEYIGDIAGKPILDIGIGGGRTVEALRKVSTNYIGIDYVSEMVVECQKRFPGVHFEQGDARKLISFENNSFNLIFFSMNGISMVDHEGRIDILKEIYRLLSPGGVFLFSTYNQDSADYKKRFHSPDFMFSKNPFKLTVRGFRYGKDIFSSMWNRYNYRKLEVHSDDYSIVNDRCHNYATMLYYISLKNQYRQLATVGFDDDIVAFDLAGNQIKTATLDDSIFYMAKKSY